MNSFYFMKLNHPWYANCAFCKEQKTHPSSILLYLWNIEEKLQQTIVLWILAHTDMKARKNSDLVFKIVVAFSWKWNAFMQAFRSELQNGHRVCSAHCALSKWISSHKHQAVKLTCCTVWNFVAEAKRTQIRYFLRRTHTLDFSPAHLMNNSI